MQELEIYGIVFQHQFAQNLMIYHYDIYAIYFDNVKYF